MNDCGLNGRICLLVLTGLALMAPLAGCGGSGSGAPSPQGSWTCMVYMAADNNLSDAGMGDINEMERAGSSDDVNIVVQAEFSSDYTEDAPAGTVRGRIVRDDDTRGIGSGLTGIGDRDMSDPDTLTEFIRWAAQSYPADHYALVLWDHGDGWKSHPADSTPYKGALQDDTSSGTTMSLPDIASAVRLSGVHFDVINFDACYMGMYETAYEFSDLTDYMVFSEEVTPGDGDPYNTVLSALVEDTGMSGEDLAVLITSRYIQFYRTQARSYAAKSAVDMSLMPALHTALTGLATMVTEARATERTALQYARDTSLACKNRPTYHDLRDTLENLLDATDNAAIQARVVELQAILAEAVLSNEVYSPSLADAILGLGGLSIYMPRRSQVTDEELSRYDLLACNQRGNADGNTWGDLVDILIDADEDSGVAPLPTGAGGFTVWLEWDTDADLDLFIWEPDGTLTSPYMGSSSASGFFSADSAASGISAEYFRAFDSIASGRYDILVNYYADGSSRGATATLYFMDPSLGIGELSIVEDGFYLDLSHTAPAKWYSNDTERDKVWNDEYSDWFWWYNATLLDRSPGVAFLTGETGGRSVTCPAFKTSPKTDRQDGMSSGK